jgi:hypothetical protein
MSETIAKLVRRHDPDRFLTALFAPPDKRDALLTLYAFNHELARAREVVSQPPLALIRLQWWREVVEGAQRRHEVAEPLLAAIDRGELDRDDLAALIDAREIEAEPCIETLSAWRGYLLASAGGLAVAAARLLGRRSRRLSACWARPMVQRGYCAVSCYWLARNVVCCLPTCLPSMGCRQKPSSRTRTIGMFSGSLPTRRARGCGRRRVFTGMRLRRRSLLSSPAGIFAAWRRPRDNAAWAIGWR